MLFRSWNVGLNASGGLQAGPWAWWVGVLTGLLALFSILLPSSAFTFWITQWAHHNRGLRSVRAFKAGMSPMVIGLMVATGWLSSFPYLVATILMPTLSIVSDRLGNRRSVVLPCIAISGLAYLALYFGGQTQGMVAYLILCVAGIGPIVALPLFFSIPADILPSLAWAVAGSLVLVTSQDGNIWAFDAGGVQGCAGIPVLCDPRWRAFTASPISSSPSVANGVVYFGGGDGYLWAFSAAGTTSCGGSPKVCSPLLRQKANSWTSAACPEGNASIYSSPEIGRAHV